MHLRSVCLLFVAASLATPSFADAQPGTPPQLFTPATAQRANNLLRKMTIEEKIGQMTQLFVFAPSKDVDNRIAAGHMGSALFVTDPAEINRLQHIAVEKSRLHIPLIFGFDVIHGFRTIFPVPLAMASSWDPATVESAQSIAASEANSVGIHWAFAPMLDIARDPRWGRIVEGAGEDPYLGAAIARAQVRGFQGPAIGTPDHLLACAKHFAGYGAAEGGRDYDESFISDVQMQNIYLPPFHAAVDAGVGSLMSAYMDLNDVPATANVFLLHDTLRTQWGFKGFVVSDANAVKSLVPHGFAADPTDAALRAARAGVNMEMALDNPAYDTLVKAYANKQLLTAAQIDAAVLPILEAKIQLGIFEHPYHDVSASETVLTDPMHRVAALHTAEQTMVLLQNKGNLLPLNAEAYKRIAVIGPTGINPRDYTGSWTFVQNNAETVTLPKALATRFGDANVQYAPGVQIERLYPSFFDVMSHDAPPPVWSPDEAAQQFKKAVDLARKSDLIILTMGEHQNMSGEAASRSSLELPGEQDKLITAIAGLCQTLGKPVVLVLQSGRPLDITNIVDEVPAVLQAWYPGTRGGEAIANLLFGDATPGGHLPLSWPRDVGAVPMHYDHNLTQDAAGESKRYWNEPATPLFPFGFGLTYSTFAFSDLKVDNATSHTGSTITVSVDITNTGDRAADDVAQLYIHQRSGLASRPVRQLKGFQRVTLAAHERRTLRFMLSDKELTYYNSATHSWVVDPATFDLYAGDNADATLTGTFNRTQ